MSLATARAMVFLVGRIERGDFTGYEDGKPYTEVYQFGADAKAALFYATLAGAEATLALAEEQRIANQIALAALDISMENMQAAQERRDDVVLRMMEDD